MKTIAIANQKGGTGKTTTTYNLGIALTQQGYRVLMVDFDPQGNLSCYCGIPPEKDLDQTITELLMKTSCEKPIGNRECVYQTGRKEAAARVDFIPSNLRLAGFELAMGTMMCREVLLKSCLEQYNNQYDYCLIDCSPSVGLLLTNALAAANEIIIPMQAQPFSVVGMSQLTSSIANVQRKINPGLRVKGILLTMTEHTNVSDHYCGQVRSTYGNKIHVFTTEIPRNVKVQESQANAEPMLDAIGREALRLNRDSIAISHEPVHNESTRTQLNSREEAVTYDVHEEPRRLPDSEPFPAEPAEPVPEPLREAAFGISGAERADALRPADAGGHAADELQSNRTDSTADGGQDPARADADHPTAGPQDEPAGLDADDQQPEKAGGGSSPSDAVRSLTEAPAQAESEQSPSAFALPEFPPTLLPQLLAMETSSRASNAEYLTFYNKNPLLIDRLRFVRESYKDIFTELLLADDTRVGFHRQDNGLLVWQGAYLTRSAETLLSWRAVANALNDLIEQHELIAAIDPKKLPQAEEQLSFELPDGSPPSAENNRLEKDDFLTPEKQETVIRSALPVAEYNAPQMDDGSVITDEEVNWALAAGSNFENSKFRIYQQFTTTQGDHAAFLKKEYGSGGRSWDYQSGAHGWVDHGPAGPKVRIRSPRVTWRSARSSPPAGSPMGWS